MKLSQYFDLFAKSLSRRIKKYLQAKKYIYSTIIGIKLVKSIRGIRKQSVMELINNG